jgi:hypothetical protein
LISIYVMALGLAVLILAAPLVFHHMPLALMILWIPVLAPLHLTPVVPLLMGLWAADSYMGEWQKSGAVVSAALCALWLKLGAGMTGYSVDLWQINGWSMNVSSIYGQFHSANSLRTVTMLVAPLAKSPDNRVSMSLLFNLLQVLIWGAAAYFVAGMREILLLRRNGLAGQGGAWTAVLSLTPGVLTIWFGYVAVSSWLQVPGPRWLDPLWLPAQVVLAGFVALGLDGLWRYLHQPIYTRPRAVRVSVPPRISLWGKRRRRGQPRNRKEHFVPRPVQKDEQIFQPVEGGEEGMVSDDAHVGLADRPLPAEGNNPRRKADDIIMIELD